MDVEERLLKKKEAVERELERILSQEDSLLFKAMRHAVLSGGKRFRPLLAFASGECFGVSQDVVLPFACALELIHNYSLVHDDLPSIDNDDYRRGQPSCHMAFGEDVALLTGDSLLTLAFEVMTQASLEEDFLPRREKVMREISHLSGVHGMIGGQLMDITLNPEELTEEVFHDLILKKTGGLITASVKTGALLAGAGDTELEAINQYGQNIGLAFQIRDDILDISPEAGKEALSRPNYVSLFGLETAKRRLHNFIETARGALDKASVESEELHYLALKLLVLENKEDK